MTAHPTRRIMAAVVLAAVAMSGCSLFEPTPLSTERPAVVLPPSPSPSPSQSATPGPPASSTPPPTQPSPSPPPAPPVLLVPALPDDDRDDIRRIYEELVLAAASLGQMPDVTRVEDVYTESCPCFGEFYEYVEELERNGWRSTSPPQELLEFEILSAIEGAWSVRVVTAGPPGQLVDEAGNVVRALPGLKRRVSIVGAEVADGRWKVAGIQILEEER